MKRQRKKSPLQKSLDEFGKKLSVVILVFCGILFGVSVWRGEGIADAFLFAVALAVGCDTGSVKFYCDNCVIHGNRRDGKRTCHCPKTSCSRRSWQSICNLFRQNRNTYPRIK